MRYIVTATRCPDDKQGHSLENAHALKSDFSVSLTHVFHREQLTVEESSQILQVDAVVGQVPSDACARPR
jgi:hypothetical protein